MKYVLGIAALAAGAALFVLVSEVAGIVVWVLALVALPWMPDLGTGVAGGDGD